MTKETPIDADAFSQVPQHAWRAASLLLLAVCALSLFATPAHAEAPSAQDQYLEVVPGGGGNKSPRQFSKSLGGSGGPVSKQQIIALAKHNAERRGRRGDKAGGNSIATGLRQAASSEAAATGLRQAAPSEAAAVVTAAAKQPFSLAFTLILVAMLLLTVGGGLWLRRRKTA